MAEEKVDSRIETGSDLSEKVMGEIGSLREELVAIRRLLEREHSVDRAIQEYRCLPLDAEKPIRWGFIGAWGKGGSNCEVDVLTSTEEDNFFNHPHASDENVASFARAFSNPNAVKICKYFFRKSSNPSREEIKEGCNLSDEELDAAVKPLLELELAEWKDGKLRRTSHNYVVTLTAMTKTALNAEHRKNYR